MSIGETNYTIHWIEISPGDSAIQPLNNWGMIKSDTANPAPDPTPLPCSAWEWHRVYSLYCTLTMITMTSIMAIFTFFHHIALARPLLDFLNVRDWEIKCIWKLIITRQGQESFKCWVGGQILTVWPFKWILFSSTFTWCYLFCRTV